MSNKRIKINSAPASELQQLYGIGTDLAQRIIVYRTKNGNFNNLEDLARVKGIGLKLAQSISEDIDWTLGDNKSPILSSCKIRFIDIDGALNLVEFFLISTLMTFLCMLDLFASTTTIKPSLTFVALFPVHICLFFSCLILYSLFQITDLKKCKRRFQVYKLFMVLAAFFLMVLIPPALYVDLYYGHWDLLLHNLAYPMQKQIPFFLMSLAVILLAGPIVVIHIFWKRSSFIKVGEISIQVGFLLYGFFIAWFVWVTEKPAWILESIAYSLQGIMIIVIGLVGLISNQSPIRNLLAFPIEAMLAFSQTPRPLNHLDWLHWINSRLPNPEDQLALKHVLDEVYPKSSATNIIYVLLVAVGGWIVVTVIESIIQLFIQLEVQKFLSSY